MVEWPLPPPPPFSPASSFYTAINCGLPPPLPSVHSLHWPLRGTQRVGGRKAEAIFAKVLPLFYYVKVCSVLVFIVHFVRNMPIVPFVESHTISSSLPPPPLQPISFRSVRECGGDESCVAMKQGKEGGETPAAFRSPSEGRGRRDERKLNHRFLKPRLNFCPTVDHVRNTQKKFTAYRGNKGKELSSLRKI